MKKDTIKYHICSKHYSVNDVMSMTQIEDLEVLSIKIYDKEINQIIVYDTQNHKCFLNDKCMKFNPEEIDVDYVNFKKDLSIEQIVRFNESSRERLEQNEKVSKQ